MQPAPPTLSDLIVRLEEVHEASRAAGAAAAAAAAASSFTVIGADRYMRMDHSIAAKRQMPHDFHHAQ